MTDTDKRLASAKTDSDEDIILALRSKEGDHEAFSRLVSKYGRDMLQYVRKFGTNAEDAEDICQESYRKAYMSLSSFNPEYSFRTWLFSIALHSAIDHFRRKSRLNTVKINSTDDNIPDNTTIAEESPEDTMIDEQSYNLFIKTIEELPEKYRKIAELRLLQDYSYEEISKTLNIPLNTVRTRIRRAKERIGKLLKEE